MHKSCAHCASHHEMVVDSASVFYRSIRALDGVSFATSCGKCVALLGPNGAGKSTLLKAIAGLLPVNSGHISWRGTKVAKWSREIAYLPQRENVDWNFPITVEGVIRMGRFPQTGWWRTYAAADEAAIAQSIATMGLQDLTKRQISELSGGQQQRVFLARAMAQQAHVLLLDEPFSGLDYNSQQALKITLRNLASEGRLVIASHHELSSVAEIYDEVLLLNTRTIAFGTVAAAFTSENIKLAYGLKEEPELLVK